MTGFFQRFLVSRGGAGIYTGIIFLGGGGRPKLYMDDVYAECQRRLFIRTGGFGNFYNGGTELGFGCTGGGRGMCPL